MSESLFNKVTGLKVCNTGGVLWNLRIFKNIFLQNTSSGCFCFSLLRRLVLRTLVLRTLFHKPKTSMKTKDLFLLYEAFWLQLDISSFFAKQKTLYQTKINFSYMNGIFTSLSNVGKKTCWRKALETL